MIIDLNGSYFTDRGGGKDVWFSTKFKCLLTEDPMQAKRFNTYREAKEFIKERKLDVKPTGAKVLKQVTRWEEVRG